jgi:phage-related protein
MAKPITVSIVGNAGPLKKAVGEAEGSLDKLGGAFKKIGIATAAGFAAVGAGAAIAISRASDLNETISKVSVVFGEANKSVEKFANDAATKLGQTRQQALDASASFGIFGKAAGLSGENLATFSTDFTSLASDLASFNNTSPEQAINAIGAALRGESEPLRGYGVLLNDATLKTAALELGIYSGSGALTAQQKILAAQKVIYEQTGDAQGDFERTSDGLANSQKILSAQLQNVVTDIGSALLPIALKLATVFSTVLTPSIAFINEKVLPILTEKFTDVGDFIANKVVPIVRDVLIPIFLRLAEFITKNVVPVVMDLWKRVFSGLAGIFDVLVKKIQDNRENINKLVSFFRTLADFIVKTVAPILIKVLGGAFTIVTAALGPVLDVVFKLMGAFADLGSFLIKVAKSVLGTVETMVNGVIDLINKAIDGANKVNPFDDIKSIPKINLTGGASFTAPAAPTSGTGGSFNAPSIADRISSPSLAVPSLNVPSGGGGGSRSFGETGSTPAQIQAAIRASSGTTSALTTFGMAERIAAMESSRANQAAPVNITVNTVTADANLPNLIVESLQRYNLISGPVDVQIAI